MIQALFLADFTPIRPEPGLIIWTTIIFALFWFLISRFAFKPIAQALKERETDIQSALDEAKTVRTEMANLKVENEALMAKAQEERAAILREAKEAKESIINEAKQKARDEASKIVASAKVEIENQKMAAIIDVKNQLGSYSIKMAEKIIRRELNDQKDQQQYVQQLVEELKLN